VRSFADIPLELASRTASGERIALILLDALGLELLMRERDHRLVERLDVVQLDSQFPSTTAAHVTTMHLAEPVEQHGLYEWRVLEPSLGEVIVPLRFRRDASDVDFELAGRLDPRALISSRTIYEKLTTRSIVVEPVDVAASPYDRAATSGAQSVTFAGLDDGLKQLVVAMRADPELGYAYVYWPMIDAVGHRYGPSSHEFRSAARTALDAIGAHIDALARLRVTVLLTADHGQIDVHPERVDYLDEIWPELSQHLTQRAAGSCRDVFLHVSPDQVDQVIANLAERLHDNAHVCRAIDLFPNAGLKLTARLADVAVLPANGREAWLKATPSVEAWNLGQHGGRTDHETATYLAQVRT
jgi:Type I phosphodiesterase / nucleotide pyrophosphatase